MHSGDLFGEMALFNGNVRTATVAAHTTVVLLSISYEKLGQYFNCIEKYIFRNSIMVSLENSQNLVGLDEEKMKLDYVLGLKIEDFLERRLQTQVFKLGLAKSIHHARVLIRQRHIRLV